MSFATIAQSVQDFELIARVEAAATSEAWNNPVAADTEYGRQVQASSANTRRMVYPVAVAADVEAAYASALAAGNPSPGGDPSVITDGMILANVQAKWPEDPAP